MNVKVFKENIEKLTGETKQNKIADALNISASKVSKWFTGELLPTFADILNISEKYRCSIDWLIGNEYKNDYDLSVHDICSFLIKLDDILLMNIELKETLEEISFVDENGRNIVNKKYKETLPTICIHNSASVDNIYYKISHNIFWIEEYCDNYSYNIYRNLGSFLKENQIINNFLTKYIKIKNAFYENLIPPETYDDIINSYLNELPKTPIDYFPFGRDENDCEEETPFDTADGDTDDTTKETSHKAFKEWHKVENAISLFEINNNIQFIE